MAIAMGKVCAIMGMDRDLGIFLVDLDRNYDDVKDANGFVEIQPNFRLKGGDENLVFYVVNGTLYLFYIFQGRGGAAPIPKVYSIDLQQVSEMRNLTLDKTNFQPCADCLAAKSLPTSLAYPGGGTKLLIFSTNIRFHFCNVDGGNESQIMVDKSVIDFELYDTEGGVSTPLPQLIVCCLPSRTDVFMLYDSRKSTCYAEFPGSMGNFPGNSLYMMSFDIVSFALDEDKFIITTDFGRMFSLDLKLGDRWRLCEEEGYQFDAVYKNILAPNGICLDAAGANDSRKTWSRLQSDQHGHARKRAKFGNGIRSRSRRVRFPETEIDKYGLRFRYGRYNSSSFDLLKVEDDPSYSTRCCILQQAFDFIGAFAVQEISTKLYMCLDVLKLNLEEFPAPAAADDKFVKRIMSFIFTVSEMIHKPVPHVEGMFYY